MGSPTIDAVRAVAPAELDEAARALARGMRDNPLDVRAFGGNAAERTAILTRFFRSVLRGIQARGRVVVAVRDGRLVGVCCSTPPDRCQPTALEKVGVLPAVLSAGLVAPFRVLSWTGEWARHDPRDRHWHLGPVGVDPDVQGRGIGGAMLADACARADEAGEAMYLETDKAENLPFYERARFAVRARIQVLGVPNWLMWRAPRRAQMPPQR
jgi:GNAT superfamily N-acetyltransferase